MATVIAIALARGQGPNAFGHVDLFFANAKGQAPQFKREYQSSIIHRHN